MHAHTHAHAHAHTHATHTHAHARTHTYTRTHTHTHTTYTRTSRKQYEQEKTCNINPKSTKQLYSTVTYPQQSVSHLPALNTYDITKPFNTLPYHATCMRGNHFRLHELALYKLFILRHNIPLHTHFNYTKDHAHSSSCNEVACACQ